MGKKNNFGVNCPILTQLATVSRASYGDFVQGVKFNIACYKIFKFKKITLNYTFWLKL